MATVRGMTPEAIKALLRKEMGDYQALSEAVGTARVASKNAVDEVKELREKINNVDFDIDMSKYDKAMEQYQKDLESLDQSLSEATDAAIEREKELAKLVIKQVDGSVVAKVDKALEEAKRYADREGGVGGEQIVDVSVIAKKLADGAVVQDKIAANAVVSDKIAAEAIVASKLAANAVVAGKIAANAVLAENIAANSITGDHIQANSITANKLTIRPGNLFPDPHFKDKCWGTGGAIYAHENNGGELRLFFNGNDNSKAYAPEGDEYPIVVEAGAHYRFSAVVWANNSLPIGATVNISVLWKDKNSSEVVERIRVKRGKNEMSFNFKVPDNLTDKRCTIAFSVDSTYDVGQVSIWNVSLVQASDGNLIVDGSIYARHLTAGSVTTDSMSANSIHGDRIRANTLDAKKIRAKSLTSDQVVFKNGFIKNAMIANGTIESGKIKALDAGKITSGTIDSDRIGANTITGDKIVANSITAGEIRADAFVQNGLSLIEKLPDEQTGELVPTWSKAESQCNSNGVPIKRVDNPPVKTREPWYELSGQVGWYIAKQRPVKFLTNTPYSLSFLVYSNAPGLKLNIGLGYLDEDSDPHDPTEISLRGGVSSDITLLTSGVFDYKGNNISYERHMQDLDGDPEQRGVVENFSIPLTPTLVSSELIFFDGKKSEYVNTIYIAVTDDRFSIPKGTPIDHNVKVQISDLKIEALIPNQRAIDKGQDELIRNLGAISDRTNEQVDKLSSLTTSVVHFIARSSFTQPEMVIAFSDQTVYNQATGIVVVMPRGHRTISIYMPPGWDGEIVYSLNYNNGSTYWYRITPRDFKDVSKKEVQTPISVLPNTYPYKHCLHYNATVPIGKLDSVVAFVRTEIHPTVLGWIMQDKNIAAQRPVYHDYYLEA